MNNVPKIANYIFLKTDLFWRKKILFVLINKFKLNLTITELIRPIGEDIINSNHKIKGNESRKTIYQNGNIDAAPPRMTIKAKKTDEIKEQSADRSTGGPFLFI